MILSIRDAALRLDAIAPSYRSTPGRDLEVWVFLELGAALKDLGIHVLVVSNPPPSLSSTFSAATPEIYVRTSQRTALKSARTSWIELHGWKRAYEIHPSCPITGVSGTTHEMDVCVVAASSRKRLIAGVECKDAGMQKNAVRAIMGWTIDLRAWKAVRCLLGTGSISAESARLASHYGILAGSVGTPVRGHLGLSGIARRVVRRLV